MSTSSTITPQDLLSNPTLLTANAEPDFITHAYDGLVGAVLNDGHSFITSPNITYIPSPTLGGDREVYRRSDYRYGPDDPLQWPQLFVPEMPHLAAIPSRPSDPQHPMTVMWMIPTVEDFSKDRQVALGGLRHLDDDLYNSFRLQVQTIKPVALKNRDGKVLPQCAYLADLLDTILFRLGRVASTFETVKLNVSTLQCVFLELWVMVDYLDCYQVHMNGQVTIGNISTAKTIGAFTTDANHCEMLFKAKLPVWFVRPFTKLHNSRIAKVVQLDPPESTMALNSISGGRVITSTRSSNPVKYNAIMKDTLSCMRYPDVFNSVRSTPGLNCPIAPQPSTSQINRQQRAVQYSPYSRRKRNKLPTSPSQPAAGRDKFVEPSASFFPPPIPVWSSALQQVNRDPSNLVRPDVHPTGIGYLFPEPASFTSIQDSNRRTTFFRTWLKYRSILLHRVVDPASTPEPQNNYFWRQLLSDREPSTQNTGVTRASTIQALVKRSLQGCQANAADAVERTGEISWHGKLFEALKDAEYEEILWELMELNFQFELLALDSLLTLGETSFDRQQMVEACFYRHSGSLMVVQLSSSNRGLADESWEARAPFYQALRRLMVSWAQSPASFRTEKLRWKRDELEVLEQEIATFYTQSFYNFFHRAPVVPCRLSHSVAQPLVDVNPSEPRMLNPKPNVYYDLSILQLSPT